MYKGTPWQQQLQQLYNYMAWQAQRIDKLEQSVAKLSEELSALKDQKRIHIDKIEYKFDQLKVERLDGTLTIGVSPGTLDAIEDMTVNGASMNNMPGESRTAQASAETNGAAEANKGHHELLEQAAAYMQSYMDTEAWVELRSIETKYGSSLDDGSRTLIMNDIRNQIPARIRYYMQQASPNPGGYSEEALVEIADKLKADIRMAMDMYLSKLQGRKG